MVVVFVQAAGAPGEPPGDLLRALAEHEGALEGVEAQIRSGSDPEVALRDLPQIGEGIDEVLFALGEHAWGGPSAALREAEDLLERFGRVREEARLKAEEAAADPLRGR